MLHRRYSKDVMEPFALTVISKSFDSRYSEYTRPTDTDNFDFISPDGVQALEVVSIIPDNEIKAYEYETQHFKGKTNLNVKIIKCAKIKENGSLLAYYGGSIGEIIRLINERVVEKCEKAKRRSAMHKYESVDLCVCVQDGSLMDLQSYIIADFNFTETPFKNIFFITPSYFFRYTKEYGFEEYPRMVV